MKKTTYFIFAVLLFSAINIQGQTLINVMVLKSVNIDINGSRVESEQTAGRMIIPYTTTKIKLYENDELTYWVEIKFRQLGENARLSTKTFVELAEGKIINGNQNKTKRNIEKGQQGWFTGTYYDSIEIKEKNDLALEASFAYDMRFKN